MFGMNRAAVERFTKMVQLQGELVAGGSFTGMQSEKARPHQSVLDVWGSFPIFFQETDTQKPTALMPKQLKFKKLQSVCFPFTGCSFTHFSFSISHIFHHYKLKSRLF